MGLQRQLSLRNILNDIQVPFKVLGSLHKARKVLKEFRPDVAIGVGGYASAPLLWAAQRMGIPTLIQEQNGFAGLANKTLGKKAGSICVAYEGMERFFPADRIVLSGNPIRSEIVPATPALREEGVRFYGMDPDKKHLLVVGGSLGSGTLNRSMQRWIEEGCAGGENVEILWQCGRYYKAEVDAFMAGRNTPGVHPTDFIARMDLAYAMADLVISRSGASTVSELCAAHKAAIFVPSPNVAEDHQTHNAMALVRKGAAMMIRDEEAPAQLLATALYTLMDAPKIAAMEQAAAAMALPDAAQTIADEVYRLIS